jgi:hypothetical protein
MPAGPLTGALMGANTGGANTSPLNALSGMGGMIPMIGPMLQGGIGLFQGLANLFKPKAQRPVQEVPESMRQATANAERLASMNQMPGYANTVGQLDTATGSALNTLKESQGGNADLSQSVADLVGKKNEALIGLGTQNANFKVGTNQALQNQLNAQAGAEQAAFDYNEKDLYDSEAAAESAMTQASISNIFNAANTASGVASYNNMAKMYGNQNGANPFMKYFANQNSGTQPNANVGVSNTNSNPTFTGGQYGGFQMPNTFTGGQYGNFQIPGMANYSKLYFGG